MRRLKLLSTGAVLLVGYRCATYPLNTTSFFLHAVEQVFHWLFAFGQHTIPRLVCLVFPLHRLFTRFLPSWATHATPYHRYPTPRAEQKYWDYALRWRKTLYASDARMHHSTSRNSVSESTIPLPGYFVPRLLPLYRESREVDPESREYELRVKDFMKWRRMIYPEKRVPSLRHAHKMIKQYSTRDRREIYRISRMVSDEEFWGNPFISTSRYRDIWEEYLEKKGPDIAIVFS